MKQQPGTALLLTVMIMAVLTVTTLEAIAIRFDQFNITDRINNSAIAKSAADAGVFRLKYRLANDPGGLTQATATDLETGEEQVVDIANFRPRRDRMMTTIERSDTRLPKCIAVAVLSPWVNDGQYLFRNASPANPALIFHYANIINDTSIGTIPGNADNHFAETTIASLTNMGHFYNPYAPVGSVQSNPNYWLVNVGGPMDEFLSRKTPDGVSSFYRNLDLLYVPYLPRFVDSGLLFRTAADQGHLERRTATELRQMFERVIRDNNFKVWLDASVSQVDIHQYGFADLFTESSDYRINWLQPRLWNDTPELDLVSGIFVSRPDTLFGDNGARTIEWERRELPLLTAADTSNWNLSRRINILKGTRTFAFVAGIGKEGLSVMNNQDGFEGQLFGSLEGIRINQPIRFRMFQNGGTRHTDALTTVLRIREDSGRIHIRFSPIAQSGFNWDNVDYAGLISDPFPSTDRSLSVLNLTDLDTDGAGTADTPNDGRNISLSFGAGSDCNFRNGHNCLAVGDLIDLVSASYASGQAPVWGKVLSVSHSADGTRQISAVVDSLRLGPKPLQGVASTEFTQGGTPKIAFFGGEITTNHYDGGTGSIVNDLWYYTPSTNTWEYLVGNAAQFPRLSGAAMSFDSAQNRLLIFGGYSRQPNAVGQNSDPQFCHVNRTACRDRNRPGMRMARYVSNRMFSHPIGSTSLSQINYANSTNLTAGTQYVVRVLSTLPSRSGLERWHWNVSRNFATPVSVNLSGNDDTTISLLDPNTSLAGLAAGDQVYISGALAATNAIFEAWATIQSVNFVNESVTLRFRGYHTQETSTEIRSINIRVLSRETAGEACSGAANNTCQFANRELLRGYSVGDLVALEEYTDNNTRIRAIFTGYIAAIDNENRLHFTIDETVTGNPSLQDYVGAIPPTSVIRDIPAPVFGAKISRPVNNRIYLTGGASSDFLQSVHFQPVWVFDTSNNSWSRPVNSLPQPLEATNYNLRLIGRPAMSQIFLDHINPTEPITRNEAVSPPAWDSNRVWEFRIRTDGGDANAVGKFIPNLPGGTPIVLERRLAGGPRETFRAIFVGFNSTNNTLRLRHDSRFPLDTGFSTADGRRTVNIVATFQRPSGWIGEQIQNFASSGESLTWNRTNNTIRMTTRDPATFVLPVGAVAMIWQSDEANPGNNSSFIFSVKNRTVSFDGTTYTYIYTTNGPILPSPDPLAYQTTVFNYRSGTTPPSIITQGAFFGAAGRASTWIYDPSQPEPAWQVQNNSNVRNSIADGAPAPRVGYASATHFDGSTSRHIFAGGVHGVFASVWELREAQATPRWQWHLRRSPDLISQDIPNTSHGALSIVSQGASQQAVFLGGKIRTEHPSVGDGRGRGTFHFGMPDISDSTVESGRARDGSTFVVDPLAKSHPILWSLSNNLDPEFENFRNSLTFNTGFDLAGDGNACAFIGQTGCRNNLVNMLGRLGRISDHRNRPELTQYNANTWEASRAVVFRAGTRFLFNEVAGNRKRNAVLSSPERNGWSINARWDQEGFTPYLADFSGDKTTLYSGFAILSGGGAVLFTSTGVGEAITMNRGSAARPFSYCAKSDLKRDQNGNLVVSGGAFDCDINKVGARFMTHLPDNEDVLFMMNASVALASLDTFRVVGYYAGVKRVYSVNARNANNVIVQEVAP